MLGTMGKAKSKGKLAGSVRERILEAAERRFLEAGPASIRLQEIAADVGITHPAILHHFGSRAGLVEAVVEHATRKMQDDLVRAFEGAAANAPPDGTAMLERVFETLANQGQARSMAWLLLSGHDPMASAQARTRWRLIVQATHALRPAGADPEDTAFTVLLSALALFGQALAGPGVFDAAGLGRTEAVQRRWRAWLAGLLAGHLARASAPHATRAE
jgi:AcrR family transcriptional regulator